MTQRSILKYTAFTMALCLLLSFPLLAKAEAPSTSKAEVSDEDFNFDDGELGDVPFTLESVLEAKKAFRAHLKEAKILNDDELKRLKAFDEKVAPLEFEAMNLAAQDPIDEKALEKVDKKLQVLAEDVSELLEKIDQALIDPDADSSEAVMVCENGQCWIDGPEQAKEKNEAELERVKALKVLNETELKDYEAFLYKLTDLLNHINDLNHANKVDEAALNKAQAAINDHYDKAAALLDKIEKAYVASLSDEERAAYEKEEVLFND